MPCSTRWKAIRDSSSTTARLRKAQGTGTEEWGGGGDYWGGENMTLPFAGHPVGAKNAASAVSAEDRIESAYRFLLADLMPFGKNARIQLEHGGTNESTQHYETVTYWYGLPAPSLVQHRRAEDWRPRQRARAPLLFARGVGAVRDRLALRMGTGHRAGPRDLSGPDRSRPHHQNRRPNSPCKIDPKNLGVMLRRKLDYCFPNQRAEVFVAAGKQWQPAGVWYLAGSNTCVYSNPGTPKELGATQHIVQTSNRRFRDDEFLLPLALTKGRASVRIRVKFTPVTIPLYPGYPLPDLAWSEIEYTAYSYRLPKFGI